jgi:hypothetical protein
MAATGLPELHEDRNGNVFDRPVEICVGHRLEA